VLEEETNPVQLIGDVAEHDRSANIAAIKDALATDTVVLICWMTIVWVTTEGVGSRAITDKTTLIINARLDAMRRVDRALARPKCRVD
jgi:hypothetical protein